MWEYIVDDYFQNSSKRIGGSEGINTFWSLTEMDKLLFYFKPWYIIKGKDAMKIGLVLLVTV